MEREQFGRQISHRGFTSVNNRHLIETGHEPDTEQQYQVTPVQYLPVEMEIDDDYVENKGASSTEPESRRCSSPNLRLQRVWGNDQRQMSVTVQHTISLFYTNQATCSSQVDNGSKIPTDSLEEDDHGDLMDIDTDSYNNPEAGQSEIGPDMQLKTSLPFRNRSNIGVHQTTSWSGQEQSYHEIPLAQTIDGVFSFNDSDPSSLDGQPKQGHSADNKSTYPYEGLHRRAVKSRRTKKKKDAAERLTHLKGSRELRFDRLMHHLMQTTAKRLERDHHF